MSLRDEWQAFRPGERYEELRLLGEGGMGRVYRAWDRQLRREVVLKVPRLDTSEGDTVLHRFLHEARHLARIQHPRVVAIYDVEEGPPPFLVQERLHGRSYEEILAQRGTLSRQDARTMFRELAEALAALHEAGVVHRDLKPGNFFLRDEGGLCLLDFGLAIVDDQTRLTGAASFVGSLRWVPPEVIRGDDSTPASDVYQAGLILYEVLTGGCLDRPDPPEWDDLLHLAARGGGTPDPGPDVPEDVARWLRLCCAWRPEERPRDGRELLALLEEGSSFHDPVDDEDGSRPLPEPRRTEARRRPSRRLLFGGLALLVAILLSIALRPRHGPAPMAAPSRPTAFPVGMQAFPDGLFLHHRDPRLASSRWQLVRDGRPTREGGFHEAYGRWEAELDVPAPSSSFLLRLVGPDGKVWEERPRLPATGPALAIRARSARGRLHLRWTGGPPIDADLFLARDGQTPTRKGRFRDEARLVLTGPDRGALRYELRLGRWILAAGRLENRLNLLWADETPGEGALTIALDLRTTFKTRRVDELVASAAGADRLYLLLESGTLHALRGEESPDGRRYRLAWTRTLPIPPGPKGLLHDRSSHLLVGPEGVEVVHGSFVTVGHSRVSREGLVGATRHLPGLQGRSAVLADGSTLAVAAASGRKDLLLSSIVPELPAPLVMDTGQSWVHAVQAFPAGDRFAVIGNDGRGKGRLHLALVRRDERRGFRLSSCRSWPHRHFHPDLGHTTVGCALEDGRVVLSLGDRLLVETGDGSFRELPLPIPLDEAGASGGIVRSLGGSRVMAGSCGADLGTAGSLQAFERAHFFLVDLPADGPPRLRLVSNELPIPNLKIWRVFTKGLWHAPRFYVPFLQSIAIFLVPDFDAARLEGIETTALEMRHAHVAADQLLVLNDAGRVYGLDLCDAGLPTGGRP